TVEPAILQYREASARLFLRAQGRAPAARALEAGRENPGGPAKDRNSGQNRPAAAPRSPRRPALHRQLESGYPVRPAELPFHPERETAGPSRKLRHLPSTIRPGGRDRRAAPSVALRCSRRPSLRCANAVAAPLPALLLVSRK